MVVVGAGLAGLTAARRLQQRDFEVVVLEASDRIGGRLLRQEVAGVPVDGGGAWVGPTQDRVLATIAELGLQTAPTYDDGRHLLKLEGRMRARAGSLPPLGLLGLVDAAVAQARLDRVARRRERSSAGLDTQTVGDWIDGSVRTHGARTLLRVGVSATTGVDAHDVSLLAFAAHVRAAGGIAQLLGVRDAAQDARIEGGAVSLCEGLERALGPGVVHRKAPVLSIRQEAGRTTVRTGDGQIDAHDVVLAVDPRGCASIDFGPGLPSARRELQDRWVMGSGIKFHVAYERAFWRDAGLSGQFFSDDGFVRITFDATLDDDGPGILVGFLGDALSDDRVLLGPAAREARATRIAHELGSVFGPDALTPLDYVEQDWRAEPFVEGCVPAIPVGVLSAVGDAVARPWGTVHWAGAESSPVWEGHMDGAVRSAERVAAEIAAAD